MSANEPRKFLGRSRQVGSRATVYQVADGLEIEANEQYDVVHKRVLFDDVMMVTIHRELGIPYLVTTGLITLFCFGMAIFILLVNTDGWPASAVFGVLGLPSATLLVIRWFSGVNVVTVFGRRSKAVLHFTRKKHRAREVYNEICAAVRQKHDELSSRA